MMQRSSAWARSMARARQELQSCLALLAWFLAPPLLRLLARTSAAAEEPKAEPLEFLELAGTHRRAMLPSPPPASPACLLLEARFPRGPLPHNRTWQRL